VLILPAESSGQPRSTRYYKPSEVRPLSNHHRFADEERFILMRVIVKSDVAQIRRSRMQKLEDLKDQVIFIDDYNVLITTESVLGCHPVYLCDDGFLRDNRGSFRSYKTSPITSLALNQILDLLALAGPSRTEVLLDQQMSRSGEMAEMIRGMMAERHLCGTARTARDVDRLLKAIRGIVLTSDGNVIDSLDHVMDLPGEIARRSGIRPLAL